MRVHKWQPSSKSHIQGTPLRVPCLRCLPCFRLFWRVERVVNPRHFIYRLSSSSTLLWLPFHDICSGLVDLGHC
ncbi:hypothetical protein ACSBR2_011751 [Camellia fascicularis]